MADLQQTIIGKVSKLTGQAFAKNEKGELRELQVGDPVYEGDVVSTPPGAKVELAFNNGGAYFLRDSESVTLDGMVFGDRIVESADGALFNDDLSAISKILEDGGSLDRLFQETSAGGSGGVVDESHSFVQLLRIAEAVTPLGFGTTGIASGGRDDDVHSFVQLSRIEEGVTPLGTGTLGLPDRNEEFESSRQKIQDLPSLATTENVPAVLGSASVNITENDGVLSASGTLRISDPDSPATFVAATIVGTFGTLTISDSGVWVFTADPAKVNLFNEGSVHTDVFTVRSADGTTSTVTINVTGTEDVATLTSATANLTETNAELVTGGTLVVTDIDAADATVVPQTTVGGFGNFVIDAAGVWTYRTIGGLNSLNVGQVVTENFVVRTSDGGTTTVIVNITGTEDVSTLTSATAQLTETNAVLSTGGTLVVSDLDSTAATVIPQTSTGTYGSFTISAAGVWSFTTQGAQDQLNAGQLVSETFTVATTDGGASTVTVNIVGTEDVSTLTSASVNLVETNDILTTGGTLVLSDLDSLNATVVAQTTTGAFGTFSINPNGVWTYSTRDALNSLAAGQQVSETFTVATSDGGSSSVTVNIVGTDFVTVLNLAASATVSEGGSIVYTASVTNPAETDFTVNLSNGQSIVIAAHTSSASITVAAPSDDPYVDGSTTSTTITGTSGGNFENLLVGAGGTLSPVLTTVTDTADTTVVTLSASAGSVTEGGTITYTASVNNPVTGSDLIVTLTGGVTITIPVGSSSANSTAVATRSDEAYLQGTDTITKAITGTSGGNFEALTTTSTVSTSVVDDADTTVVTLSASAGSVTEGGTITYTASVNNPVTGSDLIVTLTGGVTITIPVGSSSANSTAVATRSDEAYLQGTDTITKAITGTSGGNFEALTTTSTVSTSVVDDADTTVVTLSASAGSVTEGGTITYTASVNNPVTGSDLIVTLTGGVTITIPVGSSSANSTAVATRSDEAYLQGTDTITKAITGTSGGNFEALTTTSTVSTSVVDDADTTVVTLSASAGSVTEGGTITYTASVNNPVTGSDLIVTLTGGVTITIPVGSSSANSTAVATRSDEAYLQGTDTITKAITGTSGGNFEALTTTSTVSTSVVDDADTTVVTLSASAGSVTEGGTITYTASVNNPVTGSDLIVTLTGGVTITIPVGSSSANSTAVATRSDEAYLQGTDTITKAITGTSGGNFEALTTTSTVSTSVVDDADTTVVTLSASAGSVTEGGTITYTASVNNPVTGSDLIVTLTGGVTITIPVGSSSANSTAVATRSDDAYLQGTDTITKAITGTSGGNFEALTTTSTVSTSVVDDADTTVVTLSASAGSVTEGGTITYTASVNNPVTGSDLIVTLTGGVTITIPVGSSSANSTAVATRSDEAYLQGTDTITKAITGTSGGNFEALTTTSTVSTSVVDDADTTVVTLSASAGSVTEGGTITYTASVNNPVTGSDLIVTLTGGVTITIPVGSSSANSTAVATRSDEAYLQGTDTITKAITGTSGGNFEALTTTSTVSTSVVDDADTTVVTLSASAGSVTEGGTITYTASVNNPVTGSDLIVTLTGGVTITIPVGSSSANSTAVATRSDDAYLQGTDTITKAITGTSGGNFEALTTTSTVSTSVVDDADTTVVTLSASAGSVTEGGTITYTASVNNPVTGSDLIVTLTGGVTITIPVGSSSANSTAVATRSDEAYLQGTDTITKAITGTSGGNFEALTTTSTVSTSVVDDADTTVVTLSASAGSVTEGGTITYTASVNNPVTGSDLIVTLTGGVTITIPVGSSSANSTAVATRSDDAYLQGTDTITKAITGTSGGNFEALTTTSTVSTSVVDDADTTVVTLSASAGSVTEGGTITYTASVNNPVTGSDLIVTLTGGVTITIPVGSSSANSTAVATRSDEAYLQGTDTITKAITGTSGGNFEALTTTSTVSTSVVDDADTTVVTLSASAGSVTEGGTITYTASVNNPVTGSDLIVTLTGGVTITIPVGSSSANSTAVATRSDEAYLQGTDTITKAITGTSGGNFEALTTTSTVSTSVVDDADTTVVTLSASAGSVTEGGTITYTASVNNPVTGSDLIVTLTGGVTITIPVGSSSANSTAVATRSDDAYLQGTDTITKAITGTSGGNFEALTTTSTVSTSVVDDADTTVVTLSASAGSVTEGGTITYTASVNNPVTGSDLIVTLTGGVTITIPVGSSSANSTAVATRSDDAYLQGTDTITKAITGTSGGNFEALTTTSTVSTSVVDDADTTVVTLSASAGSVTEGGTITYTASVNNPVTGSDLIVTLTGGVTITIPVGSSSANSTAVATRSDEAYLQGTDTITKAITGTSGGNFEALTTTSTVSTSVVDDADTTVVTLSASAGSVTEGGTITYTASVNNPVTGSDLIVTLTGGVTITIPVGSSSANSTAVATRSDEAYLQGTDTITKAITGTSGGNFEALTTTSTVSTSVVDDADTTVVTLSASAGSVTEGGTITYTASVNNPVTGSDLIVTLTGGVTITIPVGSSSANSTAVATRSDEAYLQGTDTITKAITGTSGGNFEALTTTSTVSTSVVDDADTTVVTLSASAGSVTEGGTITYTASVNNPVTGSDLIVTLTGGVTITIPVGSSSANSTAVATRSDEAYLQGTDTITKAITGTSGGNFEALTTTSTVSTSVVDDADTTVVTLSASAGSVTEGGTITYTASVNNPVTGSDLIVTLTGGVTITIPVGSSSANSTAVATRSDEAYLQGTDTITKAITGTSGGNFEALTTTSTVSTSVVDDADTTVVTLSASAGSVTEGGTITYTASVNNPVTGSDLIVTLTGGVTITIPVGSSSANSTAVATRSDEAYLQGTDTITKAITGTSGGNFEALTTTSTVSTSVVDDADTTVVTLSASAGSVTEGGTITYTASVNNPVTGSDLIVTLTGGVTITIPVGSSSANSTAVATRSDEAYLQGTDTITKAITGTSGGNFEALTTTSTVSTSVVDDADTTVVTLSASAGSVTEGGTITYTASVNNPVTGSDLIVTLTGGVTITIPVGSSSANSTAVATRSDEAHLQGTDTITYAITGTSGGNFEALTTTSTVSTSVVDDADTTVVTLSASAGSVTEGGTITYTASVNNPVTGSDLIVTLTGGVTITIPVGSSSANSTAVATRSDEGLPSGHRHHYQGHHWHQRWQL
ncbi:MAG: hypothetical protein IPJ25_08335 [Rhodocyclaceae bacterium]|nr:hypothetical protein [Rhodocyclaceae bacterium]